MSKNDQVFGHIELGPKENLHMYPILVYYDIWLQFRQENNIVAFVRIYEFTFLSSVSFWFRCGVCF